MARIGRPGLSREKKDELWASWKSGQCASDIALVRERTKGAIHHVLAANGGIAPARLNALLETRRPISALAARTAR